MKSFKKYWYALIIISLLSPIGIFLPEALNSGSAWGEWSTEEVAKLIGYEPNKMKATSEMWKAPLPDYNLPSYENASLTKRSLIYIISGLIGIFFFGFLGFLLNKYVPQSKARTKETQIGYEQN